MSDDTVFLELEYVLELHTKNIQRTGGTDGQRGREGEGLLSSALAQPQAQFGGEYLHPTLWAQAAAYVFHIAQNQPFLDGNKRTALSAAALFLRLNGYLLRDDGVQLHRMMLDIAERKTDKEGVAKLLTQRVRRALEINPLTFRGAPYSFPIPARQCGGQLRL